MARRNLSAAEEVASLFVRDAPPPDAAADLRQISQRLPVQTLARIDALAEHAELSRNAMVLELLRVGIASVQSCLPPVVLDEVNESANSHLCEMTYEEN
jgi:hypothetical protein